MRTWPEITKAMSEFGAKHRDETFYVLAFDAGYIGVNSLEELEKNRIKYATRWNDEHRPLSVDTLDEEQLEAAQSEMAMRHNPVASVEAWVAKENADRATELAAGNPYDDPTSRENQRLRMRPGNWRYGQLIEVGLERAYAKHYERGAKAQASSEYQKAVSAMATYIDTHRAEVLGGLRLSADFMVITAEHEY